MGRIPALDQHDAALKLNDYIDRGKRVPVALDLNPACRTVQCIK
jgi:hypothetical protein